MQNVVQCPAFINASLDDGLEGIIVQLQPSRPVNGFQPRALSMMAYGFNENLQGVDRLMGRDADEQTCCGSCHSRVDVFGHL